MDLVVQARSGLLSSNGRQRNGLPAPSDSPLADYMCAVQLAFGVATALYRREQTGRGGEVDVSLLAAALTLQNNLLIRVDAHDGAAHEELRAWLEDAREHGVPYEEQASRQPGIRTTSMGSVYYRTFATKDAAIAVACVSQGLQRRLLAATGLEDRALGGGIADRAEMAEHYAGLQREMEEVIAGKTTAEWQTIFNEAGLPASGVKFPMEMLEDAQVQANGLVHDLPHEVLGPVRIFASPLRLDKGGFAPGPPVAAFGSETRAILTEAGLGLEEVEALLAEGVTMERGGE